MTQSVFKAFIAPLLQTHLFETNWKLDVKQLVQMLDGQVEHPYLLQAVQTPLRIYLPFGHKRPTEAATTGGFRKLFKS